MKPWLSVIIPTYNGEKHLASALHSVVIQTDSEIQCVVIDDGSTDSTDGIINSFANKIPITHIQCKHTGNWVTNTNTALENAIGEYACLLHQDDLWLPKRLDTIRELIDRFPSAELFISPAMYIDANGHYVGKWSCPIPRNLIDVDQDMLISRLLIQNFIAIPAPVFKRKKALEVGGLDDSLWYTADWDFWLKLVKCGQVIYYPKPTSCFRIHSSSQTIQRSSDIENLQEQLDRVFCKNFEQGRLDSTRAHKIKQAALFSNQVNVTLAAMAHGQKANMGKLLLSFFRLGPTGWHQYFRDSRILERISARIRAKVRSK